MRARLALLASSLCLLLACPALGPGDRFKRTHPSVVDLGVVPRGCGRVARLDTTSLQIGRAIVGATSSNPAVQVGFTATSVQLVAEASPALVESVIASTLELDLATELFVVTVQLRVTDADGGLPPLDFGGVENGYWRELFPTYAGGQPTARAGLIVASVEGTGFFTSFDGGDGVQFVSPTSGAYTGVAHLGSYLHCPGYERVALRGDGVPALLSSDVGFLDFGTIDAGTSTTRVLQIQNNSYLALEHGLSGSAPIGESFLDGVPVAHRDAGALVPGVSRLSVTFTPSRAGTWSTYLDLRFDERIGANLTVPVYGTAR